MRNNVSLPRHRINLLKNKIPLPGRLISGFPGSARFPMTANLNKFLRSPQKGYAGVEEYLKSRNISRSSLVDSLAFDLRSMLRSVSCETLAYPALAKDIISSRARAFIELANLSPKGDEQFVDLMIEVLLQADEAHFSYSAVHAGVVTFYAAAVTREMGFSPKETERVKTAAVLHDIGKIGVDSDLLPKADITRMEKHLIDEHLVIGTHLLQAIKWLKNVVPAVKHHHPSIALERGPKMDVFARILLTADRYDGLTSSRKYKMKNSPYLRSIDGREIKVFSPQEAFNILKSGEHDPPVVRALEKVVGAGGRYVFLVKDLFKRREIKFVWPGIQHLIWKTIIPPGKDSMEVDWNDIWLSGRAPILWILDDNREQFSDLDAFIIYIKQKVHAEAKKRDVENSLNELLLSVRKASEALTGSVYEVLLRVMDVDAKTGKDLFPSVLRHLMENRNDMSRFIKEVDSMFLDPQKNEYAFFSWLAGRLWGEPTDDVPVYGETDFIRRLNSLLKT